MIDEQQITHFDASIAGPGLVPIKEGVDSFLETVKDRSDSMLGLDTGFIDLDLLTDGLQKSRLYIIAGRPGMGKSLLCYCIAQQIAVEDEQGVAFFSPTESAPVVAKRMLERTLGFSTNMVPHGRPRTVGDEVLESAANVLTHSSLYLDDSTLISTDEVRSRCLDLKQAGKTLSLIIIDDIFRLTHASNPHDRLEEVERICADLKALARDLDLPIILVCGVSRNVENRKNKKPSLGDIQHCEAIERAADVVMFVYRDEYYDPDTENSREAEVLVAKNRMGQTGSVSLSFDGVTGFGDLDRTPDSAIGHMQSFRREALME